MEDFKLCRTLNKRFVYYSFTHDPNITNGDMAACRMPPSDRMCALWIFKNLIGRKGSQLCDFRHFLFFRAFSIKKKKNECNRTCQYCPLFKKLIESILTSDLSTEQAQVDYQDYRNELLKYCCGIVRMGQQYLLTLSTYCSFFGAFFAI